MALPGHGFDTAATVAHWSYKGDMCPDDNSLYHVIVLRHTDMELCGTSTVDRRLQMHLYLVLIAAAEAAGLTYSSPHAHTYILLTMDHAVGHALS